MAIFHSREGKTNSRIDPGENPRSANSGRSVRTYLVWLVLACLLPGVIGAASLFIYEYHEGRAQLEKDTIQTARALVQTVDGYLVRAQAIAQTLSTDVSLANGDFALFHQRAREALALVGPGFAAVVTDAGGQQILHTRQDFGRPLPHHGNPEQVRRVFATGRPAISDLFIGGVLQRSLMSIDVPVLRDGKTAYVLSIGILPEHFAAILDTQNLPPDWVATIFDSSGTAVARTRAAAKFVGQKGTAELIERIKESSDGVMETTTLDGIPVLAVYSRSPTSDWSVFIGIPKESLAARFNHALSALALGVAGLFTIGLGLAWFLGGRIARAFRALKAPAVALGAGNTVSLPTIEVKEAAEVVQAMGEAAGLLNERTAALQAAKLAAERADNAKSRFLAATSHDLRQPLFALGLYVGALKSHVAGRGQALLDNLGECVTSLSKLLTDLLDYSKLEAGIVLPEIENFPVSDVLDSLVAVHGPEAQVKGLRFCCAASRLIARTDPILLKRILGNLIENAVRYTEHGGVVFGCRRRGGKVWVEVWDSGIGIPADKTGEIFEEFSKLGDEARTRGGGLGLTIVAKTAALLGVEVEVRSWPGRGSVFAVELPLGQKLPSSSATAAGSQFRSLRIALVEDNALALDALSCALEAVGHRVVAAASAAELCSALGNEPPDIMLADYRLGHGETGLEAIDAVRAVLGAALPAIIVTGDTDPHLVDSFVDRGVIVLHKPLELEILLAHMDDLTLRDEVQSAAGLDPSVPLAEGQAEGLALAQAVRSNRAD